MSPNSFAASSKATLSFRLDEAAGVVITAERAVPGRRAGSRCVKPTRKNAKAKRCTRFVREKGGITRLAPKGTTQLRFTRRFGAGTLPAGKHRITVRAKDGAGNAALPITVNFTIAPR
jgi:hypothetical protein